MLVLLGTLVLQFVYAIFEKLDQKLSMVNLVKDKKAICIHLYLLSSFPHKEFGRKTIDCKGKTHRIEEGEKIKNKKKGKAH